MNDGTLDGAPPEQGSIGAGDPGPLPLLGERERHDLALLTGEELLALFASAMIRQQQTVIELRDALGAAMRDNERIRALVARTIEAARHDAGQVDDGPPMLAAVASIYAHALDTLWSGIA